MRAGTAQEDADAAGIADNDRVDFQQCQPQGVGAGTRQAGLAQGSAPQSFKQGVGQARQQLPELIGPPAMAGGPPGKQIQLLILDPVLGLSPRAQ